MSDFNINIKQTQDGSSIRDANSDLKDLKNTVKETTGNVREHGETFSQAGLKVSSFRMILSGLSQVVRGNVSGMTQIFRGLSIAIGGTAATLLGWIGIITALATVTALVSRKLGELWYSMKYGADQVAEDGKKFKDVRKNLEDLDKVKLGALEKEIEKITKASSDALDQIDKTFARINAEADADTEREIAKLKTQPESPDRERAIADLELKRDQRKAGNVVKESGQKLQQLGTTRSALASEKSALEADLPNIRGDKNRAAARQKITDFDARIAKINEQMADERTKQSVAMKGMDTAVYSDTAKRQQIDRQEAEGKKKEEHTRLEADLAAIQEKIKAAKDQQELEHKAAQANIEDVKSRAQESAGAASAFTPDKRLRGKALKRAQSHDVDLDLKAQSDAAYLGRLEKALKDKDVVFERILQALEKQAEDQKNAIKNLPL